MHNSTLKMVVIVLIIALAGFMYYQYTKTQQGNDTQIKVETPAGTIESQPAS